MKKSYLFLILILTVSIYSCKQNTKKEQQNEETTVAKHVEFTPSINNAAFDTIIDGKAVKLYWLKNKDIQLAITNFGGRFVGLWIADKNGKMTDVIMGMDSAKGFIESSEPYFGATIGRVGNRIAKGKFSLNGKKYSIPLNNGKNTLHGGFKGFQYVVWDAVQPNDTTLVLSYLSPDKEEGYPGNLKVKVTYSLTDSKTVKMEYEAETDQPTVVNLTNHSFFNLNGEGTILNHRLQIYADTYTPVDETLIPFGTFDNVTNTPFDFLEPHTIGERIENDNIQLKNGLGYDHNYVLNGKKADGMNHAATVVGDKSGIIMDVYTQEPGLQFYSGNFMQSKNTLKLGVKDDFRTAFSLETQHFPDAPNQPGFPSITLNPGEKYHTVSEYRFSVE
uniref:aldose epimerase family protein n=1 Tax=Mariniflexile sp. TaxID=1979402 RepID=UPI0040476332